MICGSFNPVLLQSCGKGKYSASGATGCIECPAGKACLLTETETPSECTAGQYALAGAPICLECPIGHYCPNPGMSVPLACLAGYYQSATGMYS